LPPPDLNQPHRAPFGLALLLLSLLTACQIAPRPGSPAPRRGDEIVAAGQFFHTGTPVVLWMDPGGYDAYRVERRFSPLDKSGWEDSKADIKTLTTPNRYGLRADALTPAQVERVRGGGWDLPLLQQVVDQFVIHFDDCGTSRECFRILQDNRDLSVHFMLDVDGTIYQTLDLKERAFHATIANTRSIGVEIANLGCFGVNSKNPFADWYATTNGLTTLIFPSRLGPSPLRTPNFLGHPARQGLIPGVIQGKSLVQYDFTPQQYAALTKLSATLCQVFPKIKCDYPRDAHGKLIPKKLPDDVLKNYHGLLGHYHIQTNKTDPGPAFQWDLVVNGARRLLQETKPPRLVP
jgi:N-acetyl-anhydromuramyl-L-alanine amidase AmpD